MSKEILITGATGLIGRKLAKSLSDRGDNVTVFTRNKDSAGAKLPFIKDIVEWDYNKPMSWKNALEGKDAVVHLAGVNLFSKRWNKQFKDIILKSRELSTHNLVQSMKDCQARPGVFISASGVGFYGDGGEKVLTEDSASGDDFLAAVCKIWENKALNAADYGIRSVQIRTGIVLSKEDGALKQLLTPFRFFIGGPLGSGNQWFPWLHIDDIVRIYIHAIDRENISGPINAASPNVVRMKEFAKRLGKVLKRPSIFSVPEFILKIVIGEAAGTVTSGQNISSEKILNSGFSFKYPDLEEALIDLLKYEMGDRK